jgi:outer membrane protein assembly factor BamB
MVDGQLLGVGGATMWDTDQEVIIDLEFAASVRVTGVDIQAWHAANSSKGKAYGVGTLKLLADATPAAAAQPLARLADDDAHSDWGTPIPYRLTGLTHEGKSLRLVLTPRAGRGIYVAEIVVRGDAPWLRQKLVGAPAGAFTALDLTDVDGDGQAEAVAGTSSGTVLCFDAAGKRRWRADFGAPVRALAGVAFTGAANGTTVVVGGDRDAVCAFAGSDGKALWTHDIERYKTAGDVRVLFAADLDGKGQQVAVAGSRNWRFHVLGGDGKKRWHYESVHASTAGCAADLDGDGRQELLLGTAYYGWHAANPDGSSRWSYRTLGGPGCNAIAAGDVTGDGVPEVFFGGQDALVQAADASGKALWQANTGDVVTGLAVLDTDGDGRAEVLATSLSFNLFCFDGKGRIRWRRDLGSPIRALAVARDGAATHVVLATQAGGVWLIDPRGGERLAGYDLGAGATGLAARSNAFLVADEAGRLTALEAGVAAPPKAP